MICPVVDKNLLRGEQFQRVKSIITMQGTLSTLAVIRWVESATHRQCIGSEWMSWIFISSCELLYGEDGSSLAFSDELEQTPILDGRGLTGIGPWHR